MIFNNFLFHSLWGNVIGLDLFIPRSNSLEITFQKKKENRLWMLKKKKKWPTGIDQMLQTSPGIRETVRMLLLLCSHFLMFRKSNSFWSEIGMNSKAIRMKLCSMNRLVLKKKKSNVPIYFSYRQKKKVKVKTKTGLSPYTCTPRTMRQRGASRVQGQSWLCSLIEVNLS